MIIHKIKHKISILYQFLKIIILTNVAFFLSNTCECRLSHLCVLIMRCVIVAVECPEGQVYNSCGSACVEMCYNVSVSTCEGPCVAGCECPDGLIMDGDRCVTQQQCGCEHNGLYYSVSHIQTFTYIYFQLKCRKLICSRQILYRLLQMHYIAVTLHYNNV